MPEYIMTMEPAPEEIGYWPDDPLNPAKLNERLREQMGEVFPPDSEIVIINNY